MVITSEEISTQTLPYCIAAAAMQAYCVDIGLKHARGTNRQQ